MTNSSSYVDVDFDENMFLETILATEDVAEYGYCVEGYPENPDKTKEEVFSRFVLKPKK